MEDYGNKLAAKLVWSCVADQLRAYQGNLAFAGHIVQNKWLPPENDPIIQQYMETLRQYLTGIGRAEEDRFLLRLGLTVPGVQRGIVPPLMVLDANRGGFSVRRQREAEGGISRLREALAIGRRFVPNLSPDTQQAVAELANLAQSQSQPDDMDLLNSFSELPSREAEQLAERAIEYLDDENRSVKQIGTTILQQLACFRLSPLSERCCYLLMEREVFWPSNLYRDSGDAVAGQLISRIGETAERLSLNHLLLCLAWTRSDTAHEIFRQWTRQPPTWASILHVPPQEYLHNAGWCLDEDGQRRDLVSKHCFRLIPTEEASSENIHCLGSSHEKCPSCGGDLTWLFDFSRISPIHFRSEFAEAPRKVACCSDCSCYGPIFTAYHGDGTWQWLAGGEPCKSLAPADQKACIRKLAESPCSPFACAEPFGLDDASTFGGIPMWLQGAEFPRCVECGRVMTFLAQLDNGPLGGEGIYYAFFCESCHVAAVTYQQT